MSECSEPTPEEKEEEEEEEEETRVDRWHLVMCAPFNSALSALALRRVILRNQLPLTPSFLR